MKIRYVKLNELELSQRHRLEPRWYFYANILAKSLQNLLISLLEAINFRAVFSVDDCCSFSMSENTEVLKIFTFNIATLKVIVSIKEIEPTTIGMVLRKNPIMVSSKVDTY